jgi:hypothetical protein
LTVGHVKLLEVQAGAGFEIMLTGPSSGAVRPGLSDGTGQWTGERQQQTRRGTLTTLCLWGLCTDPGWLA